MREWLEEATTRGKVKLESLVMRELLLYLAAKHSLLPETDV